MSLIDKPRVLRTLRKTPSTLAFLLDGVDQARAVSATDGPDGWSVLETMCHLRDFERILAERIRLMVDQDNPRFALVDHLDLVTRNSYATQTLANAFAEYLEARRALIAYLDALPDSAWARTGTTGAGVPTNVAEMAINIGLHDIDHTEQIGRSLGVFASPSAL
jgi:hypothetical protein